MRTIIIYASNSGNTKFTAELVAETLRNSQHFVVVQDVVATTSADLGKYDIVVLGSCTWSRTTDQGALEAQLPEQMYEFAGAVKHKQFPGKLFAVFGLGRHEYTGFCAAANHLQVLVGKLGGSLLLPPLRLDGFPQQQEKIIKGWTKRLASQMQAATV